jgi:hypothetical protein
MGNLFTHPEPLKVCSSCRKKRPRSQFHKSSTAKDGLFSACKLCVKERDALRNRAAEWARRKKRCPKCGTIKTFPEFSRRKASKDGLQPHCKACQSIAAKKDYLAKRQLECDLAPAPAPAPTQEATTVRERLILQPTLAEFIEVVDTVRDLQADLKLLEQRFFSVSEGLAKEIESKQPAKKKKSWWRRT